METRARFVASRARSAVGFAFWWVVGIAIFVAPTIVLIVVVALADHMVGR